MENKNVGWLIIGISILIILIIFIFNQTLTEFVDSSCTLAHGGDYCPMYDTIYKQTSEEVGIPMKSILIQSFHLWIKNINDYKTNDGGLNGK